MLTALGEREGNTKQGVNRKSCNGSPESQTRGMCGCLLCGTRETSGISQAEKSLDTD